MPKLNPALPLALTAALYCLVFVSLFSAPAMTGAAGPQQQERSRNSLSTRAACAETGRAAGIAALSFRSVEAAMIGSYAVRFTVGEGGIAVGGGVRIAFPTSWFTNPYPVRKVVQVTDPLAPHYVSAVSSRPRTRLAVRVDRSTFPGKKQRFSAMMNVSVRDVPLREGDTVTVTLAKTTAPYLAGRDQVLVAVDAAGDGVYRLIEHGASYRILPGAPVEVAFVGPSQAISGQPIQLQITALDRFCNVAQTSIETVTFTGVGPSQPLSLEDSGEPGRFLFQWTPSKQGFVWPKAQVQLQNISQAGGTGTPVSFTAACNPIRIFDSEAGTKIYWGELHAHSSVSKDGTGKDNFAYARNAAHLDFFAPTEHAEEDGRNGPGIRPAEWAQIIGRLRDTYEPGKFVGLLGFECSMRAPSGHHNVLFRSLEGNPIASYEVNDNVEELWTKLTAGSAITVPHHPGIIWGGWPGTPPEEPGLQEIPSASPNDENGPLVDWSTPSGPAMRPLVEIYSLHGTSERYDPTDPLAYENVHFTIARSARGPHYASNAWKAGHWLGVVAGSDNHEAQPGSGGLTAVMAPELTRGAVFDALAARRTYATTGARVYMEFEVDGKKMGERGEGSGTLGGSLLLAAPSRIAYAEVVRLNLNSGRYRTIKRWSLQGRLLQVTFSDTIGDDPIMYYVRAELTDKIRGWPARVWSSPIWIYPQQQLRR